MSVSVIIPTLNEVLSLGPLLQSLHFQKPCQVVVADGGSTDGTVEAAKQCGAEVVISPPGRGGQMNAGAAMARGNSLLFIHADTVLPNGALSLIGRVLSGGFYMGGAFSIRIKSGKPSLYFISRVINLRSRHLRLPYGDQGIFTTREIFVKIGGFRNIPIMEDIDFIRRLNREGPTVILPQEIIVSARRYNQEGIFYTILRDWLLAFLFFMGINPSLLLKYYPDVR